MKVHSRLYVLRIYGFTLPEMLISIAVLTLLILFTTRLFNNATAVATAGSKRMDVDSGTRSVLDRIQIDILAMIKRSDLDCYLKDSANTQLGNDQFAFFSEVPGYYPASGAIESSVSLISYRVNSISTSVAFQKLERLAKGLLWNGASATDTPLVFLPLTISGNWPSATNATADPDYEVFGAQVFRFEYYYRLNNGSLSATPWTGNAGHTSLSGFRDVTALEITIAVIDQKSRVLVSNTQLTDFTADLGDFDPSTMRSGDLVGAWQAAADSTAKIPRTAAAAVRFAHRTFVIAPR